MNELGRMFLQKQTIAIKLVPDKHYGVLVSLMRADRPRYWSFLCVNCGSKIVELMNQEVVGMDDFFDPQNVNNFAIARHCKGVQLSDGLPCPYKYFFHVQ